MATASTEVGVIQVTPIRQEEIEVALLGSTPLFCNAETLKMKQALVMPQPRSSRSSRERTLKHDPYKEFLTSMYTLSSGPTLVGIKATAVKKAMMTGALDLPGAFKTQIGRLTHVVLQEDFVPVYGVPVMHMGIVRSAGIGRTPDVRTRAVLPEWALLVRIRFVTPNLTATTVINLLNAAGVTAGIGDWRAERGAGNFGSFTVETPDDERVQRLVTIGGRAAQEQAIESPSFFDPESAGLFAWFEGERQSRGR